LPSTAVAQDPPSCAPEKAYDVIVINQGDSGEHTPLVATHESYVVADVRGDARAIVLTPQDGVAVLKKNSDGSGIILFAPTTPDLTVTVTWRQSADPSNPDETARCSATRVLTLPVLPANPARGAKQPNPGPATGDYTFAVVPALRRPNLSPLEITIRSTSKVRYPRASERLVRWVVPMRVEDQLKYRGHLPNLAYATFAQKCRFWWLTCGPVNADVAQLNVNRRGRPDLDGSNAILRTLARSQPARWAAEYGLVVTAFPGAGKNRPFGYDVQVRQAGRLLARVRRAGRCVDERRSTGIFHNCRLARSSTLLR
jgi:hypothetical protein